MQFPTQKMSQKEFQGSKLFKEIEKQLPIHVVEVSDNEHRTYRTPSTGRKALIYDMVFEFGRVLFFVEKGGNVSRIVIDTKQEGDRVVETLSKNDAELDITPAKLAREILRTIRKEQKAELKVKISKTQMDKLIKELDEGDDEEEIDSLQKRKDDLTKGSGKLLVVNESGEVLGADGYTKNNLEFTIFETLEDAKQAKQSNDKVVKV